MSGGHWSYENDSLAREIFGWWCSPDYGDKGFNQSLVVRQVNPLEDKLLSEMLWDIFCVLHSYDWYACGDTCEETYREDVKRFKDKWVMIPHEELVKREIETALEEARQELYKCLEVNTSD